MPKQQKITRNIQKKHKTPFHLLPNVVAKGFFLLWTFMQTEKKVFMRKYQFVFFRQCCWTNFVWRNLIWFLYVLINAKIWERYSDFFCCTKLNACFVYNFSTFQIHYIFVGFNQYRKCIFAVNLFNNQLRQCIFVQRLVFLNKKFHQEFYSLNNCMQIFVDFF